MSADDIFNATVAIAREVVDERVPHNSIVRNVVDRRRVPGEPSPGERWFAISRGCPLKEGERITNVEPVFEERAAKFAAPYLQRIAELESRLASESFVLALTNARIAKLETENKSLRDAILDGKLHVVPEHAEDIRTLLKGVS